MLIWKHKDSLSISHLSQHHYHLDPRSVLVTQDVIHEGGARISGQRGPKHKDLKSLSDNNMSLWSRDKLSKMNSFTAVSHSWANHLQILYVLVPVSSDGHTFIDAVCGAGDDVVQLIGHASRPRHICHAAWPIKFGSQDVVQHATCVADLKTAGLDATNLGDRK